MVRKVAFLSSIQQRSKEATYQGSGLVSFSFPSFPVEAVHMLMFRDLSNAHGVKNVATQT